MLAVRTFESARLKEKYPVDVQAMNDEINVLSSVERCDDSDEQCDDIDDSEW